MRLAADAQKKPVKTVVKQAEPEKTKRRDLQTEGTGSGKGTCGQRALRPKEDHRDKKQSGDNRRRYTEESRKVRGT